jgi:hypothetical protein
MKLLKVLPLALCLLALAPQFASAQDFNSKDRFRKNEGAILNNYIVSKPSSTSESTRRHRQPQEASSTTFGSKETRGTGALNELKHT